MIRLDVTVDGIDELITAGYTVIRVYTDTSETGNFTTLDGTITLVAETTGYHYTDTDGTSSTWYKVAYYGAGPGESDKSDAQQGGVADAYCTAYDVRKELAIGTSTAEIDEQWDDVLWSMCVECSRLIDTYKGVEDNAYLASGSAIRYVDGNGRERLQLPWPAASISAVAVEETDSTYTTWTQGTDYFRWPYQDDTGLTPAPITRLDVNDKSDGGKSVWTEGPRRVKVTGVWGVTTAVPDIIARACKTQVAQWFKLAQQGWQSRAETPMGGSMDYPHELNLSTKKLVDKAPPRRARI